MDKAKPFTGKVTVPSTYSHCGMSAYTMMKTDFSAVEADKTKFPELVTDDRAFKFWYVKGKPEYDFSTN